MCSLEKSESDQQNNENMKDECPRSSTQSSDSCSENEKIIYDCDMCERTFATARERNLCCSNVYRCKHCKKVFWPKKFLQHIMEVNRKLVKPYKCRYCQMPFRRKNNLRYHLKEHTGEDYICKKCNKHFNKYSSLIRHYRHVFEESVWRKERIKAYIREEYKQYLQQYKNNDKRNKCYINDESQYKCDHCTGTFSRKYDLQHHKKIHTDD